MKTITVDTNLHCEACVQKVSNHLDEDREISNWSVDLTGEIKTLQVTGENISTDYVDAVLKKAGYSVVKAASFWRDQRAWGRASFNTLNCLIGCSIGDFGMVFYLQAFHPSTPLILQMILAIIAGLCTSILLETSILRYREKFNWGLALKTAFGMSFLSMVAMEIAMTATDFMITGGKAAFDDPVYWLALIPALVVGFLTPLPYNYYKLKKYNMACH